MSRTTLGKLLDELFHGNLILFSSEPKKNGNLMVYTLIAPQPDAPNSSPEKIVPFRSQTSTNSIRSTTRLGGATGSI